MWLPRTGALRGSLSALLGFVSISGAEDEEEDGGGAEPRSALLRTADPHKKEASVSLLGHSHH